MPHSVLFAAQAGVALAVLALGLSATFDDAVFVLRRPGKLARAILSMNVAVPLFAAATSALFDLRRPVTIALLTLAVSPVPPILPRRALKAGGAAAYTVGLLVAASVLAIVLVPLTVFLFGKASVSPWAIARVVALSVLGPLAAGMLVHRFRPRLAERMARPTSIVGLIVVAIVVVPIFVVALPDALRLIGNGTLAAIVAFNLFGLAVGYLLGGPEHEERTVLALTSASRHPGVALVVATASFEGAVKPVVAAIVLYLIVNVLVTFPYTRWSSRREPSVAHGVAS